MCREIRRCWKKTGASPVSCEGRLNGRHLADRQTCGCALDKNNLSIRVEMP